MDNILTLNNAELQWTAQPNDDNVGNIKVVIRSDMVSIYVFDTDGHTKIEAWLNFPVSWDTVYMPPWFDRYKLRIASTLYILHHLTNT